MKIIFINLCTTQNGEGINKSKTVRVSVCAGGEWVWRRDRLNG